MAWQTWAVCGATYAVQCEPHRQKINHGRWREMKTSRHALDEEGVPVITGIGVNACSRNAILVSQLNRPKQPPCIMQRLFTFSLTTGSYMGATLLRLVSKREMKWFQCHEYVIIWESVGYVAWQAKQWNLVSWNWSVSVRQQDRVIQIINSNKRSRFSSSLFVCACNVSASNCRGGMFLLTSGMADASG